MNLKKRNAHEFEKEKRKEKFYFYTFNTQTTWMNLNGKLVYIHRTVYAMLLFWFLLHSILFFFFFHSRLLLMFVFFVWIFTFHRRHRQQRQRRHWHWLISVTSKCRFYTLPSFHLNNNKKRKNTYNQTVLFSNTSEINQQTNQKKTNS